MKEMKNIVDDSLIDGLCDGESKSKPKEGLVSTSPASSQDKDMDKEQDDPNSINEVENNKAGPTDAEEAMEWEINGTENEKDSEIEAVKEKLEKIQRNGEANKSTKESSTNKADSEMKLVESSLEENNSIDIVGAIINSIIGDAFTTMTSTISSRRTSSSTDSADGDVSSNDVQTDTETYNKANFEDAMDALSKISQSAKEDDAHEVLRIAGKYFIQV